MRPFQEDLNCELQYKNIKKINCDVIIIEDHSSTKRRIKLKTMIDNLRPGDKIVVTKLFIFADSSLHLVELLDAVDAKGA